VGSGEPVTPLEKAQIGLAHYMDHRHFPFLTASENIMLIYLTLKKLCSYSTVIKLLNLLFAMAYNF